MPKKREKREKNEIKGFKNLFDKNFIYTPEERIAHFVKKVLKANLGVGYRKGRPTKQYKRQRRIGKIQDKYPQLTICIKLRCKKINVCWRNLEKKELSDKYVENFNPYKCLGFHLARKEQERKAKRKLKQRHYSHLSDFEIGLISLALRRLPNIRPLQVKELLSKIEHSDVLLC